MLGPLGIIAACVVGAITASYVMERASNHSGLWAIMAGVVMAFAAALCAILIGLVMTGSRDL
jgi:fructose-specific phosphotransferase system IIC component